MHSLNKRLYTLLQVRILYVLRKIEEFSAMQLKPLPGVDLVEVICPKSLEDSEYKIIIATDASQNKSDELKDLCLFVQGSFKD